MYKQVNTRLKVGLMCSNMADVVKPKWVSKYNMLGNSHIAACFAFVLHSPAILKE